MSSSVTLVVLTATMHHVSLLIKSAIVLWIVWEGKMKGVTAVLMEMFVWLVVARHSRAEWSTVGTGHGELCVMIPGMTAMLLLCADNLVTPQEVNNSTFLMPTECYYSVLCSLQMLKDSAVLGMVEVVLANQFCWMMLGA